MKNSTRHLFKLLFIAFLLMGYFRGFSQDLVILNNKDSINCRITEVKANGIYLLINRDQKIKEVFYSMGSILTYKKNFYNYSEVPEDYQFNTKKVNFKVRFTMGAGYSFIVNKTGFNNYAKGIRHGFFLDGNLLFYMENNLGFGVKYSYFRSSEEVSFFNLYGTMVYNMNTIAAELAYRLVFKESGDYLSFSLAPGILIFNSKIKDITSSGSRYAFGIEPGIAYHIYLSDQFNLAFLFSSNIYTDELSDRSRINIGIAIEFK